MKGITLTELVIAIVIVAFMLGGIFAANHAIMTMDKTNTGKSSLFIRAQAIADTIKKDALVAVGQGIGAGAGIKIDNSSNYICFHYNTAAYNAPPSYHWACYSKLNAAQTGAGSILFRCDSLPDVTPCSSGTTNTKIGEMDNDFSKTSFIPSPSGQGVFSMPVTVKDSTVTPANTVQVDVVAYPEEHSF